MDIEEKKESWDRFIGHLIEAKRIWKEELAHLPRSTCDMISGRAGKMLGVYRLMSFETMLEKFVSYWRGAGNLESLLIKLEEKHEKVLVDDLSDSDVDNSTSKSLSDL